MSVPGTGAGVADEGDEDAGDLWEAEDLESLDTVDEETAPAATGAAVLEDLDEDDLDEESEEDDEEDDEVDFAVLAWQSDGEWRVALADAEAGTWTGFRAALREHAGADIALGFASLDDSYLVVARVAGAGERVLLSDVEAADDLDFAADLLDHLRGGDPALDELLSSGDLDDSEDPVPVGDAALLEDLGLAAEELRELCSDVDADPEDMVDEIADSIGIAAQVARALDALDG